MERIEARNALKVAKNRIIDANGVVSLRRERLSALEAREALMAAEAGAKKVLLKESLTRSMFSGVAKGLAFSTVLDCVWLGGTFLEWLGWTKLNPVAWFNYGVDLLFEKIGIRF